MTSKGPDATPSIEAKKYGLEVSERESNRMRSDWLGFNVASKPSQWAAKAEVEFCCGGTPASLSLRRKSAAVPSVEREPAQGKSRSRGGAPQKKDISCLFAMSRGI